MSYLRIKTMKCLAIIDLIRQLNLIFENDVIFLTLKYEWKYAKLSNLSCYSTSKLWLAGDMDTFGHVNNVHYYRYIESAQLRI